MRVDVEGFSLTWTATTEGADLTVRYRPNDWPASQEMSFRFVVDPPFRRLRMNMVFAAANRTIDISTQPGVDEALAGTAGHERIVPGSRHAAIGGWVCAG